MDTLHQPKPGELPADGHDHVDEHEAHVHLVPIWLLVTIFAALLVLTGVTVGVTAFDFGRTANVWVALGIAVVKATLVALYFMHLRWDSPFNGLVCAAAMFFVALFIGIVVLDTKEYMVNFNPPAVTAARPAN
ncbi:MAG TPA: cytochrome C oxidase subunit IV family protein [Tepidisphaeraceae bacterium]|nr:cytochrome C oxidase subunit IV family protein [Tepidisphaeraceae bacterium]